MSFNLLYSRSIGITIFRSVCLPWLICLFSWMGCLFSLHFFACELSKDVTRDDVRFSCFIDLYSLVHLILYFFSRFRLDFCCLPFLERFVFCADLIAFDFVSFMIRMHKMHLAEKCFWRLASDGNHAAHCRGKVNKVVQKAAPPLNETARAHILQFSWLHTWEEYMQQSVWLFVVFKFSNVMRTWVQAFTIDICLGCLASPLHCAFFSRSDCATVFHVISV